jgi:hypothetical protein
MITSGELREKIFIMEPVPVEVEDDSIFADMTPTAVPPCDYKKLYTLRCGVKFKTGDEAYIDDQVSVIQSVRFKIRYNPRIKETYSVEYLGNRFDIRFIEHGGQGMKEATYLHTERKIN